MSELDEKSQYDIILGAIRSPIFRNPIKNFIDQNCGSFMEVDENTFEQGALFNEFTQLVETSLTELLNEYHINEEIFLKISEKGLQNPGHKKYFEQLISFSDYNYFKDLMTKRNYQLIQHMENLMRGKDPAKEKATKIKQQKEREDKELKEAITLSLQMDDKMRRLQMIEEEELKVCYVYL